MLEYPTSSNYRKKIYIKHGDKSQLYKFHKVTTLEGWKCIVMFNKILGTFVTFLFIVYCVLIINNDVNNVRIPNIFELS